MQLYWIWFICGILLILLEFSVPGVVICFFGVSALIAGFAKLLFPDLPLVWQILIFAVGGGLLAISCRRFMPEVFKGGACREKRDIDGDDVQGEMCICCEEVTPSAPGKVEFRGALWNAESEEKIQAGEHCMVESRNNLILKVRRK